MTDIGVVLPLRLETRFDPGTLRLRVVPDEPWFTRHDETVSDGELAALGRYLDADALASDDGARRQAFAEFVAHTGGARALWLLSAFIETEAGGVRRVRDPQPDERREQPRFPHVEGFPSELRVWLASDGAAPVEVATVSVDHARLLADFPDPETPGEHRWWEDWDEALAAGLAVTIPLAVDPDRIDVLYVTGVGDDAPDRLFASHRDEGRLAVVAPGTPTNSVDGAPAAPLGDDADAWWKVLHTPASAEDRRVSTALTGDPDLLGALPGSDEPHSDWAIAMLDALWPALWGFAGTDVLGLVDGTEEARQWAQRALRPEGPYPTLRVASQPYGLLPATALGRWRPDPGDPQLEQAITKALLMLGRRFASAAERRGTVTDASTEGLLDLLADTPTSPGYRHRRAWPLEVWWLAAVLAGFDVPWREFERAWSDRYALARRLGLAPRRRYGTRSSPRPLRIPLLPEELPEGETIEGLLARLVEAARQHPWLFARPDVLELEFVGFRVDSLLVRLVIRSLQAALGEIGRELLGPSAPALEPLWRLDDEPGLLQRWIEQLTVDDLRQRTPATERLRRVIGGVKEVAGIPPERLARMLSAVVDTATHRIDPWLVGVPARRLDDLLGQATAGTAAVRMRLCAYGFVDAPHPGTPGPTAAGLIHAPSPAQALVATVLRDRRLADPEPRWDLQLHSRTVRAADRIAEHVRVGAHLPEALGREVERVAATTADVERLRRNFSVRSEHAGRRVCDGLAVLAADPATLGLDEARLDQLTELREAVDAYGDLLVAEAVHHLTEGRAEVAGAVMDAAAGLARPPQLGLLHTPRLARAVATSVVVLLPSPPEPSLPDPVSQPIAAAEVSPSAVADPAGEAFLRDQLGEASAWTWTVIGLDPENQPVGMVTVHLADADPGVPQLGLSPGDALAFSLTDLERLVLSAGAAALPAGGTHRINGAAGSNAYERATRLVAALGRNPAAPDALTAAADAQADPGPVTAELRRRYGRVHATASALRDALSAGLADVAPDGGIGAADPQLLGRLVIAARRWGVAPDPPPEPAADPPLAATELAERRLVATAVACLTLIGDRLTAAPTPGAADDLATDDITDALRRLVSPTGQLILSARHPAAALTELAVAAPSATAEPLDDVWLPVVAAVREPLARIEAHQLAAGTAVAAGPALAAWSTKPADPWQRDPDDPRRLVVAYAAAGLDPTLLDPDTEVAVTAVDRWTETIPGQEQTTGAVFGFDAPASRAPQAILLAVPPDVSKPLDDATLVQMVAETRLLAHARMARPGDLDEDIRGLLPAVLLPATPQTAVSLEPLP